jgi:hypothetical protein
METNLKLVNFGTRLRAEVARYDLVGQVLTKDQVERFCTILARETKVPAVPYFHNGEWSAFITEKRYRITKRSFVVDDWVIRVEPSQAEFVLSVAKPGKQQLVADLYKRGFLIQIAEKTDLWTLGTPRIFYEKDPFLKSDFVQKFKNVTDIQGYRRFEVSEQYLENVGQGFSVNVSTAFFTSLTVDDYFQMGHSQRFRRLAGRQQEQKGTLMYDGPNGKQVCYFEDYLTDKTLISSGELNFGAKRYPNLYAYYQEVAPAYPVNPTDKVAVVTFSGMDKKALVPANKLVLRVMNKMLDRELSQKDKIDPQERTELLNKFWTKMGRYPFGPHLTGIERAYYQPGPENSGRFELTPLLFGGDFILNKPDRQTDATYRKHFNDRKSCLEACGCYYVPPTMNTEIHFVYPAHVDDRLAEFFASEVCDKIKKLTGKHVDPITASYASYADMTAELSYNYKPGMVVFAFDDEDSVTYFNIRHELANWQLKRLTTHELRRTYKNYKDYKDGLNYNQKAVRNWESYVEQNVYDIIQQLGCLPYMVEPKLSYDMQLVIDVSAKSTHIALSLFMYKQGMRIPVSAELIKPKTDAKKEEINKVFLEKYLKELITNNKDLIKAQQMKSMLILRDGKDCGEEFEAIKSVIQFFTEKGLFPADFKFDFIEYHKSSLKQVKIWEKSGHLNVNCLEGSYFVMDSTTAILATTGAGTINQGTAAPVMIRNKYTKGDLLPMLRDIFLTSQLNFSSPRVAQRLTFSAKRTDEQLKDRMAQEIFRIK